jgi:hypothetical protein
MALPYAQADGLRTVRIALAGGGQDELEEGARSARFRHGLLATANVIPAQSMHRAYKSKALKPKIGNDQHRV